MAWCTLKFLWSSLQRSFSKRCYHEFIIPGWSKYDHYCIEGPCRCQWIWLDAGKKSLCLHMNPRKPRESNFQTGFWPIRFLNCIGVHKILNILKCKHGWAHEYFLCYGWNFLNRSILYDTSVVVTKIRRRSQKNQRQHLLCYWPLVSCNFVYFILWFRTLIQSCSTRLAIWSQGLCKFIYNFNHFPS